MYLYYDVQVSTRMGLRMRMKRMDRMARVVQRRREKVVNQLINQLSSIPMCQGINQPVYLSVNQSINQYIYLSISQSIKQSTTVPVNQVYRTPRKSQLFYKD